MAGSKGICFALKAILKDQIILIDRFGGGANQGHAEICLFSLT